jgi:hypothetical protein
METTMSKRPVKRRQSTVWPQPGAVTTLGGYRARWLNQSIECWSALLAQASREVAEQFDETQWQLLAKALSERVFIPAVSRPGLLVADALAAQTSKPAQALARTCADLDYLHAWAVIWAVQWYWDNVEGIKKGDAWWDVDYRRAHARPYAVKNHAE